MLLKSGILTVLYVKWVGSGPLWNNNRGWLSYYLMHSKLWHTALLVLFSLGMNVVHGQDYQLVWAEEFEGAEIDRTKWQFESGPTNDNIHYYTDRPDNAILSEGILRIMALKEPYQGFEYTAAHLRTEQSFRWRYGRAEARIKLPGSPGFVPAFWMLPEDHLYGWWPHSGEIDIMEYPTTEGTKIYGTVHTGQYNLFDGPEPPQGGTLEVPDAESAFHLYAIEWSPERIDFFVDDQKYFTFDNDGGSTGTWPFDQPFYLILNLAVGGGWVGPPDETTVFPATLEVDYVRVYQQPGDMQVQGPGEVTYHSMDVVYAVPDMEGMIYRWTVPGDAVITSGENSHQATVNWGVFGGDVKVEIHDGEGVMARALPVRVTPNLIRNAGFETGVKHWKNAPGYPAKAGFKLDSASALAGEYSILTNVTDATGNPWDVQLSHHGLELNEGVEYHAGLSVKGTDDPGQITAAVIDLADFSLVGQKSFSPTGNWTSQAFTFTPSRDMMAAFNVDMGGHTGTYSLDEFVLTTEELRAMNLVQNGDFFDGKDAWELTSLSNATAEVQVEDGFVSIDIVSGGTNPWDLHFGQSGLAVENGTEYQVSFDASADAERQITPLVGMNAEPWTVYSNQDPLTLDTVLRNYSFTFFMGETTDPDARLGFDIGGDATGIGLDNIRLQKKETSGNLSNHPFSEHVPVSAVRHHPHPASGETHFLFQLKDPARVWITIYSLSGKELENIGGALMQPGQHTLIWDAGHLPGGIYLYRLRAGTLSEMKKLIIVR